MSASAITYTSTCRPIIYVHSHILMFSLKRIACFRFSNPFKNGLFWLMDLVHKQYCLGDLSYGAVLKGQMAMPSNHEIPGLAATEVTVESKFKGLRFAARLGTFRRGGLWILLNWKVYSVILGSMFSQLLLVDDAAANLSLLYS